MPVRHQTLAICFRFAPARLAELPETAVKVAIVAASLRILGGQAVQAQRLLDNWRDDPEVDAWLVPINPLPPPPFGSLLTIKYVRTVVTQVWYWPLLFRELRHADIVHVFSASYASFLLSPLPAVIVARLLRRPVILNYHSGEAPDHLRRSAFARRVMARWVDLNVVPSPFLRGVLASFGIAADVVPNTMDLRQFAYRVRDPLRPRLLSTRNFEPLYNVPCVVRAFARIQQRHPDATLTLVGGGSQEGVIRSLAASLGLRNVTFVGQVPPSEISRYYADADIYLQAPSIDNMPLSVLEAFASGLPVVSTGVGGVPAILTHGVHGLLAADNDDEALASHVIRLLDEPEFARQLAAAAHATCFAYEWSVAREGWLRVYRLAMNVREGAVAGTGRRRAPTAG
jgi:glycosyltransferase involved in cell wall biosynthesis